tara:strand:- start:4196 stop:4354 length:159 start_codon:yes stop_codon:yes gene_type:complete
MAETNWDSDLEVSAMKGDKKKKKSKVYRKGGAISYSGVNKRPNSKSKFPGMG